MNITILKKVLAGSAMAAMLLPVAASAQGLDLGGALNLGIRGEDKTQVEGNGSFNVNANAENHRDGDWRKDDHKETRATKTASTTAATLTKKAHRLNDVADFMSSIGAVIETKLALLGTTTPAVIAATANYKTQIAGAHIQTQSALNAAATINANNSTTTNAAIVAQTQANLKAAQDFLAAARADFKVMLHFLWH